MSVKITSNLDKFIKDPLAYAERFPCPTCQTVSNSVGNKKFHCPKCNVNFEIIPKYTSNKEKTTTIEDLEKLKDSTPKP